MADEGGEDVAAPPAVSPPRDGGVVRQVALEHQVAMQAWDVWGRASLRERKRSTSALLWQSGGSHATRTSIAGELQYSRSVTTTAGSSPSPPPPSSS